MISSLNKKQFSFSNLNITPKLVTLLIIFGLLPALSLFSVFEFSKDTFKQAFRQPLLEVATSIGDTIDRNLFERYGDVQTFGLNAAAHDPSNWKKPTENNPLIAAMNGYMTGYGIYKLTLFIDTKGDVLAVNSVDARGKKLSTKSIYQLNFSKEAWFKKALDGHFLKGANGFSGTAVGQPQQISFISKLYKRDEFVLPFSAPVKGSDGRIKGIWVNFADFALVEDIFGAYYKRLAKEGKHNAELTLLDTKGRILVDFDLLTQGGSEYRRNPDIIGKFNLAEKVEVAKKAVSGDSGTADAYHARKKIWQAAGFFKTIGAYDYPGLGWSVLVRVPVGEAYGPIDTLELIQEIALVIAVILIVLIGLRLGKSASSPIRSMTRVMTDIADGNTDAQIPSLDRGDEIGDMAAAVQVFKKNAIERKKLEEENKKSQEQALKRQENIEELIAAFREKARPLFVTVLENMSEMQETANSLTDVANETTSRSNMVATGAEGASENVQEVAAATEELTNSIQEISNQLAQTSDDVGQASDAANKTDNLVANLDKSAEKIGDVVSLIGEIAEQTNLLALNATIEAARAGEAGKGFAIVAAEVKELATETAKATGEIRGQIENIQKETSSAVDAIRGIADSMKEVSSSTNAIASAIEEQGAATSQISKNVQEAANGTHGVAENITGVTQSAEQNLQSANSVLNGSIDVLDRTTELRKTVIQFLEDVAAA